MKYYSTNRRSEPASLAQAVIKGLAPDKGLYMPEKIAPLSAAFFAALDDPHSGITFHEVACRVAEGFFGEDIPSADLDRIVTETLSFDIPLKKVSSEKYSLELFHGPTAAFKDVGARFMARMLAWAITAREAGAENGTASASAARPAGETVGERLRSTGRRPGREERSPSRPEREGRVTVLVATSGDTGSAVANGFLGVEGIDVVVLYPKGKVSDIQEMQFTTLGQNITALAVEGTFDDCQRLVKSAFMDVDLARKMELTSANSINVARFLPQAFYYFWGYAQLRRMGVAGDVVVCVPSGNFGNIIAGLFAKRMGLPVKRFIAANNRNDVFLEYIRTGAYSPRASVSTLANAMDVGDPSNFARIVDLYGGSMDRLDDKPTADRIRADISAYAFDDKQIEDCIRRTYAATGYLLDPHGACGYMGLEAGLQKGETGIFLETAEPAKFRDTVEPIIGKKVPIPATLQKFMGREKRSIDMRADFGVFKEWLMRR